MERLLVWIMVGVLALGLVPGLAESYESANSNLVEAEALVNAAAVKPSNAALTPTPAPQNGDIIIATDGEETSDSENTAYTSKLKNGSTGEKVKQLQTRLTELGYYQGPISGKYLSKTTAAVIAFQKKNGLTADGVAGEGTWNLMFSADALDASAAPRPTPAPAPVPYAITVDVTNQVVTVYGLDENNEYTKIVKQMICSTGTVSNPSRVGDWTLNGKTARWAYFPKWGGNAQYWTRINSSIAFHSVLYRTPDPMELATGSYYALGTRASHGCIRLQVSDSKWIYDNVGKGTVVTITEELPPDPELTQSLKPAPLNSSNMLPRSTPAPTQPPVYDSTQKPPQPFRNLNKGDKGEDVYWLQMKLKELGYYTGTVTGGFYGGTQKAVKAYQADHGLSVDGVAGIKTQTKIYADVLGKPALEATPATVQQ